MMAEGHGLRRLQMGEAGHHPVMMGFGAREQGPLQVLQKRVDAVDGIAQPEAKVGGDLIVARARGVQLAAGLADPVGQPGLDVHVDVFEAGAERRTAPPRSRSGSHPARLGSRPARSQREGRPPPACAHAPSTPRDRERRGACRSRWRHLSVPSAGPGHRKNARPRDRRPAPWPGMPAGTVATVHPVADRPARLLTVLSTCSRFRICRCQLLAPQAPNTVSTSPAAAPA